MEILDNGLRHCGIQLKKRLLSSFFLNNILDSAEVESLSKLPENGCMILANFTQKVFFGGGDINFIFFILKMLEIFYHKFYIFIPSQLQVLHIKKLLIKKIILF